MTFEEYKALPGINASFLKACSFGAWHGWNYLHQEPYESDAMKFGSAVHCSILEPEKFESTYAFAPKVDKRTKAGKEEYAAFEKLHAGKVVLDETDYHKISAIVTKCRAIPQLQAALESFEKEKTIQWEVNGVKMKARLDLADVKNRVVIDLKTTRDANVREFTNQLISLRYDVQLFHYARAVSSEGKENVASYAVAIESESEEVALYDISNIVESSFTEKRYWNAIRTAVQVMSMKERPAKFAPEIVALELPHWASVEVAV